MYIQDKIIHVSKIRYFLQKTTFLIKFVYPIFVNLYRQDGGTYSIILLSILKKHEARGNTIAALRKTNNKLYHGKHSNTPVQKGIRTLAQPY